MREFYVYGFKSRTEYDAKSARSYDDERRRLESWLGDYMHFTQTPEGKNVFLSVDSRVTRKNPFYKAWKAKSFTDGDITLHFAIFDILYDPETKMTLTELIAEIDQRLSSSMAFDESTLRKKLKEYAEEGIIRMEKDGRKVLYSRAPDTDITALRDVIDFFSEVAPCGVIGSFLQDRQPKHPELFSFKHHYITQAMDSDVMATLFGAISTWIWYLVLSTSSGSATGNSDLHGVKGNAPSIPGLPPVFRSKSRSPAYWRQTRRKSIICRKSPALASCAEPLSAERSCPKSWNGH